jgi:uncharacterized DUF497 family protein
MAELRFDWDPKKNRENQRSHKVSFEEAKTAFADEHGLLMADPDHSEDEDRFILLGLSADSVCWSSVIPIESTTS